MLPNSGGTKQAESMRQVKKTRLELAGLRKLILRRGERLPTSQLGGPRWPAIIDIDLHGNLLKIRQ
jgi:hypothetical protein